MSRRFLQSFRMFEEGVRHRVVYSRRINRFRFFHVENDDRSRDNRDHRRVVRETGIDQDQCEVFEQDVVSEALTNTCTRHMILTGCYSGTGNYLLCSFEHICAAMSSPIGGGGGSSPETDVVIPNCVHASSTTDAHIVMMLQ
ncbi:hypothetical protein GEV33_013294 [Tenebrio molitor]|uniref:Uncharacterized protein n=1 Tax=Tenebrio molitor TaxID=7067 RepID=A0A8J6L842_TENMO|nr:hypothetical protein GEV33_013294 [Tenebrio molitor]